MVTKSTKLAFKGRIMLNEDDKDDLTNIFLATRNIGLHRNRGLGYVQCELKKQSIMR